MLKHYENIMIITPVLSDDQAKKTAKEYENYLIKKNGKIVYQEHWGLKKLAYPIQKKQSGCYHLFEFLFNSNLVSDLELKLIQDERILRFITVKLNKYGIEYAERRRNKFFKQDKE
ncbi:30S ribosomal protein S6 [Blattabacterium punctulatus]|uniref:Small ribosomal subunit protein bS6 n=1 Tax=Blattabacterium punctulatus TaxID=164514 RepID=A0ABM6WN14_9FLAO|nr:30S ribosomal protein S6 [Blattabacterium punctulatus]AWU39858.1 30S ribosomal protein S6 [Blattabacterium punctulatus]AWU40402.1 30S ribosomal protein S6 [Blattabacterium punctulatus]AWU44857.1 30S ribosomal protein S6 [Blattabacterium punctulatus]